MRGLCGWRNCIRNYNLSGAVTEVNVECYEALLRVAELAKSQGDELNATRLTAAAEDLKLAINQHLRASTPTNHFYCLNINPAGERVEDTTADLLFPVLSGVTDRATGQAIMKKLFGQDFWASAPDGAGGIRTVSSAQKGYEAESAPGNYGLMGGVWPNLALWAGKAAAAEGLPELAVKGMQGTFLLSEREDAAHYNVVPGEFPEYFNGDDLKQRGMPLSPFVPGIYLWCGLEGLAGLDPHLRRCAWSRRFLAIGIGWPSRAFHTVAIHSRCCRSQGAYDLHDRACRDRLEADRGASGFAGKVRA